MKMKKVIENKLKSLYVKSVMAKNGWSKEYMKVLLVDYISCGKSISLYEFLESA